jgi:hypothetical protein
MASPKAAVMQACAERITTKNGWFRHALADAFRLETELHTSWQDEDRHLQLLQELSGAILYLNTVLTNLSADINEMSQSFEGAIQTGDIVAGTPEYVSARDLFKRVSDQCKETMDPLKGAEGRLSQAFLDFLVQTCRTVGVTIAPEAVRWAIGRRMPDQFLALLVEKSQRQDDIMRVWPEIRGRYEASFLMAAFLSKAWSTSVSLTLPITRAMLAATRQWIQQRRGGFWKDEKNRPWWICMGVVIFLVTTTVVVVIAM